MTLEPRLRPPTWLWLSVALCAALSIGSLALRHRTEARNRAVLLAAEAETIQALAAGSGLAFHEVLVDLKQRGLGAVVLSEETMGDLVSAGHAEFDDQGYIVDSGRPWEGERIRRGFDLRFPRGTVGVPPGNLLRATAVGLDPGEAAAARDAGLAVIARLSNVPGATPAYIEGSLAWTKELGATIFLPMGDQVLGRRDALNTTVESLERHGILYASPEFVKIGGDANVLAKAPDRAVRLHSAQTLELDRLTPHAAVERYVKAAKERNMRILLVRPLSIAGEHPLSDFGDFLEKIGKGLRGSGTLDFELGKAKPFEDPLTPRWLIALIGLAAVPAAYFVGAAFVPSGRVRTLALLLLIALAASSYLLERSAQLTAFVAALAFPALALVSLDGRRLRHPILEALIVTLISLVGGLAVAGMLNGLPYFVRALAFPGVKAAVFLPIVIVGGYFLARLINARAAMATPVTWGASLLGVVLLGAVGFMLARTGNEAPAGVSDLELRFRNLLDTVLMVRPRTKEFLIGHPALVVSVGLLAWLRSNPSRSQWSGGWVALLLAAAAIGQTSVVNTLCHLHTPLVLSLWRIANGLVLGLAIGLAVWFIVLRRLPKGEN